MAKTIMGRPKVENKKERVVLYLSPDLIAKIARLAELEELSPSKFAARSLENSLKRIK